jgi:hypothetical protein
MATKIPGELLASLSDTEIRRALFMWLDGIGGMTESEIELMAQFLDRASTLCEGMLAAIPRRATGDISRAQRHEQIADRAYENLSRLIFAETTEEA